MVPKDCVSSEASRAKGWLLACLLASCVLFGALYAFVPSARQRSIFPYSALCDYRMFIVPSMSSERPYFEASCNLRDACYPPIAYMMVRMLSTDVGSGLNLSCGELRLIGSIALLQCIGVILLVWRLGSPLKRLAVAMAVLLSPALICPLLRGNPSGWAAALVFVFLVWYSSPSRMKRIAAALALGAAASLKIAPCIFGVLYFADGIRTGWRFFWKEICIAALSAAALVFVPFGVFGGFSAIPQWMDNAGANAEFYSIDNPMWGGVAFANHLIDSKFVFLPCAAPFAWATMALAASLIAMGVFARRLPHRLLYIGAAMAFVTHHDYGGAYLMPAFVAWLCDCEGGNAVSRGVGLLLECAAWFFILTPLQIPNPCNAGSLNGMLQNEFLFVLLAVTLVSHWNSCKSQKL